MREAATGGTSSPGGKERGEGRSSGLVFDMDLETIFYMPDKILTALLLPSSWNTQNTTIFVTNGSAAEDLNPNARTHVECDREQLLKPLSGATSLVVKQESARMIALATKTPSPHTYKHTKDSDTCSPLRYVELSKAMLRIFLPWNFSRRKRQHRAKKLCSTRTNKHASTSC